MNAHDGRRSDFTPANRHEIVVQMRAVSRYFDHPSFVRALTNVSFEVRRGEVFGLLGPTGSGKSTALRILAGRLTPSDGKAKVFGVPPRRRALRARVGYLPQQPTHAHSQFFLEVLGLLRDLFSRTKSDSRQPKALAQTAGKERAAGLKQILVKNPALVLLDEPFSGLDAVAGGEMQQLIGSLARQGRTVILSSSCLTYTKDVCHRLAVLSRGRIEATGTLQDLLATRDGLCHVGSLLPPATADRVLEMIRRELAPSDLPGADAEPAPGIREKHQATANPTLAPLLKAAPPSPAPANEVGSTVNHDLLTALTKPAEHQVPPPAPGSPTRE